MTNKKPRFDEENVSETDEEFRDDVSLEELAEAELEDDPTADGDSDNYWESQDRDDFDSNDNY